MNITEVIVEVEAKLCGASYGPRERGGGREREKERERKSEHQLNFSKTKQHNFMYKNITHKDFDTCKPYDHMYIYFNHLLSGAVLNLHWVGGPCPITLINLSSQV